MSEPPTAPLAVIDFPASGQGFIDDKAQLWSGSPSLRLTKKEVECLRWCKEGKTNWEIGEILLISEKTVEFHLRNLMKKLGATNRMTAVMSAIKCGLISL
jgi:DNA-binding CsgD family transcriptional regulator